MKTTDEPCLVLHVYQDEHQAYPGLSGSRVTVRRPKLTQDGVNYIIDTFYAEELQTPEDRQSKRLQEMDAIKGQLGLPDFTPTN